MTGELRAHHCAPLRAGSSRIAGRQPVIITALRPKRTCTIGGRLDFGHMFFLQMLFATIAIVTVACAVAASRSWYRNHSLHTDALLENGMNAGGGELELKCQ